MPAVAAASEGDLAIDIIGSDLGVSGSSSARLNVSPGFLSIVVIVSALGSDLLMAASVCLPGDSAGTTAAVVGSCRFPSNPNVT